MIPPTGVAGRYAAALYAEAADRGMLDTVVNEMHMLGQLIDESPDFRRLLESPLLDINHVRRAALAVLQEEGFGVLVRNLVGVVAVHRRPPLLRRIVDAFASLVETKRGVMTAHVITAHPLTAVQEQQLRARLIEAGYSNVHIVKRVDPSLLGGLVVQIGARLYDSSLKSRLQRLQYAMKGAA